MRLKENIEDFLWKLSSNRPIQFLWYFLKSQKNLIFNNFFDLSVRDNANDYTLHVCVISEEVELDRTTLVSVWKTLFAFR